MSDKFDNEMLSAYFDGEVSPEDASRIEEELARSPERAKALEEMQSLRSAIRSMPKRQAPTEMHANIMAAIAKQAASPTTSSPTTSSPTTSSQDSSSANSSSDSIADARPDQRDIPADQPVIGINSSRVADRIESKPSVATGEFSIRGWRWAIGSIAAVAALVLVSLVTTPPDRKGTSTGLAVADSDRDSNKDSSDSRRKAQSGEFETPSSSVDAFGGDIKQEGSFLGRADRQSSQYAVPGGANEEEDLALNPNRRFQTDEEETRQLNIANEGGEFDNESLNPEDRDGAADNIQARGGRSQRLADDSSEDNMSANSRSFEQLPTDRNQSGGGSPAPQGGGGPGSARGGYGDSSSNEQSRGFAGNGRSGNQGQPQGDQGFGGGGGAMSGGIGGGSAGGGGFGGSSGQGSSSDGQTANEGRRFASGSGGESDNSGLGNGERSGDFEGQLGQSDASPGSQSQSTPNQSQFRSRGLTGELADSEQRELGTFVAVVELDLLNELRKLELSKEGELSAEPQNDGVPSSGENRYGGRQEELAESGPPEGLQQGAQQQSDEDYPPNRGGSLAQLRSAQEQRWNTLGEEGSLERMLVDNGIIELKLSDSIDFDDNAALMFNYDMLRYELQSRERFRSSGNDSRPLPNQFQQMRTREQLSEEAMDEQRNDADSDAGDEPEGGNTGRSIQSSDALDRADGDEADDSLQDQDLHRSVDPRDRFVEQYATPTEFYAYEYIEIEADAAAINGLLQDLAANGTNLEMFYSQSDHLFGYKTTTPRLRRGRVNAENGVRENTHFGTGDNEAGQELSQQGRRLEDEEAELASENSNANADSNDGASETEDESGARGSEVNRPSLEAPSRESFSVSEQLAMRDSDARQLGKEDFVLIPFDLEYLKRRALARETRLAQNGESMESKIGPDSDPFGDSPTQSDAGGNSSSDQASSSGVAAGDSVDSNNSSAGGGQESADAGDSGGGNADDDDGANPQDASGNEASGNEALQANTGQLSEEERIIGSEAIEKSAALPSHSNFYRRTYQFIQPANNFGRKSIEDNNAARLGFEMGWGVRGVLDRFSIESLTKQNDALHGREPLALQRTGEFSESGNGSDKPDDLFEPGTRGGGGAAQESSLDLGPQLVPQFSRNGRVRLTLIIKKRLTPPAINEMEPTSPAGPATQE